MRDCSDCHAMKLVIRLVWAAFQIGKEGKQWNTCLSNTREARNALIRAIRNAQTD